MLLDVGEFGAKEIESFIPARFGLLIVLHGALRVEFPETNLGVHLESPLLALWRHCVVHLLDFRSYVERLLTQTSSRLLPVDGARLGVVLSGQSRPARCWKHACPTRPTQTLTSFDVASPRVVKQSNRDIYANRCQFIRAVFQPCWEIDHLDRSDAGREFNLEGDPSSGTSIDACDDHLRISGKTFFSTDTYSAFTKRYVWNSPLCS